MFTFCSIQHLHNVKSCTHIVIQYVIQYMYNMCTICVQFVIQYVYILYYTSVYKLKRTTKCLYIVLLQFCREDYFMVKTLRRFKLCNQIVKNITFRLIDNLWLIVCPRIFLQKNILLLQKTLHWLL